MQPDSYRILDWQFNTQHYTQHYAEAALGLIPAFVSADDPRPAWEQFDDNYAHGGGWNPMLPGKWKLDELDYLHYPGDPPMAPVAMALLRDERILVYPHAFVCIVSASGDFSLARMD